MSSVFGNIFVASDLEEAVIDLLKDSFPTYLREIEDKQSMTVGVLHAPRAYTNRNSFDMIPGDQMPMVVVISPGLIDTPITREKGNYTARWSLGVGIAIAAETEQKADRLVKIYGAAARAILMQNQDIRGLAIRVDYLDESYDDLPINEQLQFYKSAGVYFGIEIENVIDKYKGPAVLDADPYKPTGTVQDVIVDIGKTPINKDLVP